MEVERGYFQCFGVFFRPCYNSTCHCICRAGCKNLLTGFLAALLYLQSFLLQGSAPLKAKSMAKPFPSMAVEAGADSEFVNINLFQKADYLLSALITTQARWTGSKFVNNSSWRGPAVANVKSCFPYSSVEPH